MGSSKEDINQITAENWEEFEGEYSTRNSFLKKKGKHRRAKEDSTNKGIRGRLKYSKG